MKRALIVVGALVALLVAGGVLFAVTGGPLLDLAPDELDTSEAARAKGRTVLEESFAAVGGEAAWFRPKSQSFTLRDEWPGVYALFSPWPSGDITATVVQNRHTFDSTTTFTAGADEGLVWSLEGGRGYEGTGAERTAVDNADLNFILPTTHYFVEAPQRLLEAELVTYVGRETVGGTAYDVVYLTWSDWAATPEFDQYLAYVNVENRRLEKLYYTVREIMPSVSGTMHYRDFRPVSGVLVPHDMTVTALPGDDPDGKYLHRMTVTDFAFGD